MCKDELMVLLKRQIMHLKELLMSYNCKMIAIEELESKMRNDFNESLYSILQPNTEILLMTEMSCLCKNNFVK
jgi:hypothetical protein